jgi:hypothetical protein
MRRLKQVFEKTGPAILLGSVILLVPGCEKPSAQTRFATPDQAATALHQALKTEGVAQMEALFGREGIEAVQSGDPVADQHDRETIALAMGQSWHWESHGENRQELIIGDEQWPFPVPLVKTSSGWQFDSKTGKEEVLARRIGRNELNVIKLCRDYVRAQEEYAGQPHDGKPVGLFAQRFRSSPGRQDGLFWGRKRWEKQSPLDELVTAAVLEGYDPSQPDASPFQGYHFRILTGQGPAAPGGSKSYITNGDMSGGFALLAYPAKYGFSGIMTFAVARDGIVYQKDLGADTDTQASSITEYNPDNSWTAVETP